MKSTPFFGLAFDRRLRLGHGGDSGCDALKTAIAALENQALPGGVNSRNGRPAGALFLSDLENQVLVGAEAQHGGYSIRGVSREIFLDALARIEFRVLLEVHRIPDVAVQVDDAGHHELARRSMVSAPAGGLSCAVGPTQVTRPLSRIIAADRTCGPSRCHRST